MGVHFKAAVASAILGIAVAAGAASASASTVPATGSVAADSNDNPDLLRVLFDNGTITRAQYERLKAQYKRKQANWGRPNLKRREKQLVFSPEAVTTKKGKTTLSFKTYVDTSFINSRSGGRKNSDSGFGADVKRFYVTLDHTFNDTFSARFRSDIETGDSVAHPNAYSLFAKNAWVQAKFSPALAVRIGVADLPWVPYVEDLYGYRYVEHVSTDRAHFATSADLGVHALGKFDNGLFDYQISVVNGGGYHDVKRSKTADVSGRLGIHPNEHLTVAFGLREGKLGAESYPDIATTPRTAHRYDAVVAWVSDAFRLGASGFYAKNYSGDIVTGAAPADNATGYSAWLSVPVTAGGKVALFARYDYVKPHKRMNPGMKDQYANIGVQFHPVDPLLIALVYKFERIEQGSVASGYDGTNLQASRSPGRNAYYNEIGLFAQYAF